MHFGVKKEIVALAEIKGVKPYRARLLYEAKFRTVKDVALADVKAIAEAFIKGAALSCANLLCCSCIIVQHLTGQQRPGAKTDEKQELRIAGKIRRNAVALMEAETRELRSKLNRVRTEVSACPDKKQVRIFVVHQAEPRQLEPMPLPQQAVGSHPGRHSSSGLKRRHEQGPAITKSVLTTVTKVPVPLTLNPNAEQLDLIEKMQGAVMLESADDIIVNWRRQPLWAFVLDFTPPITTGTIARRMPDNPLCAFLRIDVTGRPSFHACICGYSKPPASTRKDAAQGSRGIAVAWSEVVYYFPAGSKAWATAMQMLETDHTTKVTFALKEQLRQLAYTGDRPGMLSLQLVNFYPF